MIFMYEFKDGSKYKLVDIGFCLADIWALEELHGELMEQEVRMKNDRRE